MIVVLVRLVVRAVVAVLTLLLGKLWQWFADGLNRYEPYHTLPQLVVMHGYKCSVYTGPRPLSISVPWLVVMLASPLVRQQQQQQVETLNSSSLARTAISSPRAGTMFAFLNPPQ